MRKTIGAPSKRTAAVALGCVLALGLTACSNSISGDPTTAADDSLPTDYSVQNALTILPSSEGDETQLIVTADLDAASEQSGLERPTSFDDKDAVKTWLDALSDVSSDDAESAAVFVPFATSLQVAHLLGSFLPFDEEVGWSVLTAATFVERHSPPQTFMVVSGDFESSPFPDDLPEVADGVVTAGDGEDLHRDLHDRTAARPLGDPLRMATQGPYVAAARTIDEVSAWLDGSYESVAEKADFTAVAKALDDAGVVSAALSSGASRSLSGYAKSPQGLEQLTAELNLADAIPADPFTTVGIGWAAEDGEPVITVAIKFADEDAAGDSLPAFEQMFSNASTLLLATPLSELYTFQGAEADGSVAIVTLAPGEGAPVSSIYQALRTQDLPFLYE